MEIAKRKEKNQLPKRVTRSQNQMECMLERQKEKKLRHVIQSSGYKAGIDWAKKYGAMDILRRLDNLEKSLTPAWLRDAEDKFMNSPQPYIQASKNKAPVMTRSEAKPAQ